MKLPQRLIKGKEVLARLEIKGVQGTPFNAVLTRDPNENPVNSKTFSMEFYDARYVDPKRFTEHGQFVTRYYASTLLGGRSVGGIDLMGHEPSWKIPQDQYARVLAWAATVIGREALPVVLDDGNWNVIKAVPEFDQKMAPYLDRLPMAPGKEGAHYGTMIEVVNGLKFYGVVEDSPESPTITTTDFAFVDVGQKSMPGWLAQSLSERRAMAGSHIVIEDRIVAKGEVLPQPNSEFDTETPTKGEWSVLGGYITVDTPEGKSIIAQAFRRNDAAMRWAHSTGSLHNGPNADLMAASKELYSCLRGCRDVMAGLAEEGKVSPKSLEQIDAALQKAGGMDVLPAMATQEPSANRDYVSLEVGGMLVDKSKVKPFTRFAQPEETPTIWRVFGCKSLNGELRERKQMSKADNLKDFPLQSDAEEYAQRLALQWGIPFEQEEESAAPRR